MQYQKPKSASKQMLSRGPELQTTILRTLKMCSDLVGSTLGPGGMSVVIERQDVGLPPIITKDGVTVFRNIGFSDAMSQVLMEGARDASIRTASEAGDGTTTSTILAEAFVRHTMAFCNDNPHTSPQRVVRILSKLFKEIAEPFIETATIRGGLDSDAGRQVLRNVATVSANGDTDLADAVMKCFDICGDEGNVTIVENNGPSKYDVEKIEGYPVPVGFEDSCGPFYQKFVNDPGTQTCSLDKPSVVLYHGRINDFNSVYPVLAAIANGVSDSGEVGGQKLSHNVVIVATGFSETVLANLAAGFVTEGTLNIYPLTAPMSPIRTGQYDFLMDLAALTGSRVMDPIEYPLQNFQLDDVGVGIKHFEATRFRSNFIGFRDELLIFERIDQITKQLTEVATSELERTLLRERAAKLTSGIARLIVTGSSHGEIKERRDRAEDAVCAVRGAITHGALPGGGAVLAVLSKLFFTYESADRDTEKVAREVFSKALLEPVLRLYTNAGYSYDEALAIADQLSLTKIFDVQGGTWLNPYEISVLDSVPAVREAIRNSLSIGKELGTCGGIIAFQTDAEVNRREANETADFLRNSSYDPGAER